MKKVTVEAPASSANLGPGFDVFALALGRPSDRITLRAESSRKLSVRIERISGPATPTTPAKNGAGAACLALAREKGITDSIVIQISKGVPMGLGMGSSGASAAAAALAMNELFNLGMSAEELIPYAGEGEKVTSGAAHYDNVSASLLGGFVVVSAEPKPAATRFDAPAGMSLCVVTPTVRLPKRKTEYARSLLPRTVGLKTMVSNLANASLVVSGFARGDIDMIGRGMHDEIVEEARKVMIPGYDMVKKSATEAGAAGTCISGAGPTVLAILDGKRSNARAVLKSMISTFGGVDVKASGFVTRVGRGARKIEDS